MSTILTNTIQSFWQAGRKTRQTQKGWISGNAVCCHHRGERVDKRGRGGLNILPDGKGFVYSCFNCGFKASWSAGNLMSRNVKDLLNWLGVSDDDISKISLDVLKNKEDHVTSTIESTLELEPVLLPPNCRLLTDWASEGCSDPMFVATLDYLRTRGMKIEWYDWMWSPQTGYNDRVFLPYYHDGTIVGWTGRMIIPSDKPKYYSSSQASYVFNLDRQSHERKYVIVTEGQFDAVAVDGVAVMHNEANPSQISRINSLGKEVIVVPDNDAAGTKLIDLAIEQGWSVSLPEWGNDVKDVAKAVEKYGRIYTLFTILYYREHNKIKLSLLKHKIENESNKKYN